MYASGPAMSGNGSLPAQHQSSGHQPETADNGKSLHHDDVPIQTVAAQADAMQLYAFAIIRVATVQSVDC